MVILRPGRPLLALNNVSAGLITTWNYVCAEAKDLSARKVRLIMKDRPQMPGEQLIRVDRKELDRLFIAQELTGCGQL